MKRTYSYAAQLSFDFAQKARSLPMEGTLPGRLVKRFCRRIAEKAAQKLGKNHFVSAQLYGRTLLMPAEHTIVPILANHPQFNRPLALSAEAIAAGHSGSRRLAVIDVGANIGETIATIDQRVPEVCDYLCIEADHDLAEFCRNNYAAEVASGRVLVERAFAGEDEGVAVCLQDDGRANPSTKLANPSSDFQQSGAADRLMRLDTLARAFAETHGGVDLIKVDTEGYDFSILRSASDLLGTCHPALYFEWFPQLLVELGETVWDGFEYLESIGYKHFAFFTAQGDLYCKISLPDRLFLRSIASGTFLTEPRGYFDVFATDDEALRDRLVGLAIRENALLVESALHATL